MREEVEEEEEYEEEAEDEEYEKDAAAAVFDRRTTAEAAAEEEENAEADAKANSKAGMDVDTANFTELTLDASMVTATESAWKLFVSSAESREAAGEAIYAALFESAPSLQSLFVTPRAVQAMRFMNGLSFVVVRGLMAILSKSSITQLHSKISIRFLFSCGLPIIVHNIIAVWIG